MSVSQSELRGRAATLKREADEAVRVYERRAWVRYMALWLPIPFVVWALRYDLEAWGYVVAGVVFLVVGAAIYAFEMAAVARRDRAIEAAERAQEACGARID